MESLSGNLTIDQAYKEVSDLIQPPKDDYSLEHLVLPYGLSLLQEITFNLIVYSNADVSSPNLKQFIIQEFKEILNSLIVSSNQYDNAAEVLSKGGSVSVQMLEDYMNVKRKKMN